MKTLILAALAIGLCTSPCLAIHYAATVTRVIDGDTMEIVTAQEEKTIHLANIDCPEVNQPFGRAAARFVKETVEGKMVGVVSMGRDLFGERFAEIVLVPGGKSLNYLLVQNGLAWANRETGIESLIKLQTAARKDSVGLWAQNNPIPPWQVRPRENHPLARFSFVMPETESRPQTGAHAPTALPGAAINNTPIVTAFDYKIVSSARQSNDEVIISGRISDGPACEKMVVDAQAVSDQGGRAYFTLLTSLSAGAKSTTFEGKKKVWYRDKAKPKPEWTVARVYISCRP